MNCQLPRPTHSREAAVWVISYNWFAAVSWEMSLPFISPAHSLKRQSTAHVILPCTCKVCLLSFKVLCSFTAFKNWLNLFSSPTSLFLKKSLFALYIWDVHGHNWNVYGPAKCAWTCKNFRVHPRFSLHLLQFCCSLGNTFSIAIENWRSSPPAELEKSEVCWWAPILLLVSLHSSPTCQLDGEAGLERGDSPFFPFSWLLVSFDLLLWL